MEESEDLKAIRRRVSRLDGHRAYWDQRQCQQDRLFLLKLVDELQKKLEDAEEEKARLRRSIE